MPASSPLQQTATEFKKWRINKNGRGETTPVDLRQQAIERCPSQSL